MSSRSGGGEEDVQVGGGRLVAAGRVVRRCVAVPRLRGWTSPSGRSWLVQGSLFRCFAVPFASANFLVALFIIYCNLNPFFLVWTDHQEIVSIFSFIITLENSNSLIDIQ